MKKILVINFFPAFCPPTSGGELRYYNMYKGLSAHYDVTLLSPTYNDHKEEVIVHSETFREYRVPKEDIHNRLHWSIDGEKICSEISALVCYIAGGHKTRYHERYLELYPTADIIIHEFPYMLQYDLFFGLDNKPRVYNSHNFESKLVQQMWTGPNAQKYLDMIRQAERTLVQKCDLVFATSQEEREAFSQLYGRPVEEIGLAPNGIDVSLYERLRTKRSPNKRKKAFFIGSAHPPNLEAVGFLLDRVAPQCPEIDFYIAGKCSVGMTCSLENVHLLGLVDEKQKDELFITSDIAVNPMFSGAGTNLKTLEFLSAGIPMISTDVGVRGLDLTEGAHYIHGEREDFAQRLRETLDSPDTLERLAREGKEFINSRYSWESICEGVHAAIEGLKPIRETKPLLLAFNDYPVDKPVSGGEVRIHYLLRYMTEGYRVVYLCLNSQGRVEKTQVCEDFVQISLPKTQEHLDKEAEINSKCWISSNDIVAGNMIQKNSLFVDAVGCLYGMAQLVILEQPFLVDALDGLSGKRVIYDSQNDETKLKQRLLAPHPMKEWLCQETERLERKAVSLSDAMVCCSPDETEDMAKFFGKNLEDVFVVRNGVEFGERKYNYNVVKRLFGERPIVVFVGSGHGPNVDAAAFILRGLAKETPQIAYVLIGSVCEAFQSEPLCENVLLMGRLAEEHKEFLLYSADAALNPMEEGAGSNLKLAEYFAYGIPTVTTPFGARGYGVRDGVHAVICQREQFAERLTALLGDSQRRQQLAENALQYARAELCWKHLAHQYLQILDGLGDKKRLLLVTYRYNQPTRGGAEVFVDNMLSELAKRGRYSVTIAATDIGDIINSFHYSCDYTRDSETAFSQRPGLRVLKFPVDTLSNQEKWEKCHRLFQALTAESVDLGRAFTDAYSQPVLMGGWHFPEISGDEVNIWTSGEADLFIGGVNALTVSGRANHRKKVSFSVDGAFLTEKTVSGVFQVALEGLKGKVLSLRTTEEDLKNLDARPLGLYINQISYRKGSEWEQLDLAFDFRHVLSEKMPSRYIDAMIEAAKKRDPALDRLFYESRGPVSRSLEQWLEENVDRYDVVIAHSTPFDTLVLGQRTAKAHHKPCIALPHYHMEDQFYHWNLFYDALTGADRAIASPAASVPLFFDKIGANSVLLPGGGVFPEEFQDTDEALFRRKYPMEHPFILTLGRKAGGKNYQWVIDAVEEVNRRGIDLRLVMIGRDDDKLPVTSPCVSYLGEQPREMVLSALRACRFVVSMSESESFGIIILEAWLSGKTVIVNQGCAAFRELVDDGANGVLASRGGLPDAIAELLHSQELEKMAKQGAKKAESYSWAHIAGQVEQLCDQLTAEQE